MSRLKSCLEKHCLREPPEVESEASSFSRTHFSLPNIFHRDPPPKQLLGRKWRKSCGKFVVLWQSVERICFEPQTMRKSFLLYSIFILDNMCTRCALLREKFLHFYSRYPDGTPFPGRTREFANIGSD